MVNKHVPKSSAQNLDRVKNYDGKLLGTCLLTTLYDNHKTDKDENLASKCLRMSVRNCLRIIGSQSCPTNFDDMKKGEERRKNPSLRSVENFMTHNEPIISFSL